MTRTTNKIFSAITILALMLMALPMQSASAVSTSVVISQFQVAGTTAADEFVEIHNIGTTSIDLNGYRLVYRSATGASDINLAAWTSSTIVPAGGYYLVAAAVSGTTNPAGYDDTVVPDATYTHSGTGSLAGAGGGFAIRNGAANTGTIIDSVGYGTATNAFIETAVTTAPASNASRARKSLACQDTDNNSSDFETVNPSTPRNTASPAQTCAVITTPNLSINDASVNEGNSGTTSLNFTVSLSAPAGPGGVTFDIATADDTATTADNDYTANSLTGQTIPAGSSSYTFSVLVNGDAVVEANQTFLVNVTNVTGANVTDGQGQGTIQNDDTTTSTSEVVISQVYGGAGCTTAGCSTYTNDYIELYNRSANSVDLTGWSVQYASATGASWQTTPLSGSIAPGQYYLVQEGGNANGVSSLPTPNATGSINMSAGAAKVALVNSTTALSGTGCPISSPIVDFVGYGATANCSEGGANAPAPSTTMAIFRAGNGATDTDNNAADFSTGTPNPRNTPPPQPNLSINDVSLAEGNSGTTTYTFTVTLSSPAGAGGVTFDIATADGTATAPSDYTANSLTGQTIAAGNSSQTFNVSVNGDTTDEGADETFFVNVTNVTGAIVVDGQGLGTIVNDDVNVCTQTFTPIYSIQGSGTAAAITGNVTTQGVVVGDFETTAGVQGFYLQDATGDGNAATSDGILVFTGTANTVNAGDVVRVTAVARERFNQTALMGANDNNTPVPAASIITCGTGSVPVTDITMPFASTTFLERYEGMYIRFPQSLVIAEYFNYDQFGEIVLALPLDGEERPYSGTAVEEPGALANARTLANSLRRITLDDAQGGSNPAVLRHPNGDPFSLTNRFRGGDLVANAIGVLGFDFSLYRIYPTGPAEYTSVNPRSAAPEEVGGRLRVAAMNTLNFFLTLDPLDDPSNPDNPADNICGPASNKQDCRGADQSQPDEFTRQRNKLLAALAGLDADVIGLNELENTPGVEPLADIVSGLPGYAYIDTGVTGTDTIRVGIIYKPSTVSPVGAPAILDDQAFVNPRDATVDRNRPAVAQTFEEIATGARFTVVVNHLKSKGSGCGAGDDDTTMGQGNCNLTRTLSAQVLVDWLATDPTGSGDPDFLIMGDLNSYAMEDPIDAIKLGADDTAGTGDDFTNLIFDYQGRYAYSYTFDGQAGYLDHALANVSLAAQVTGAADWHINSDEPDVVDYDTSFKPASQEALYEPNPYRSSDHDPVVVGLNLTIPNRAPAANDDNATTDEDTPATINVFANDSDADADTLTITALTQPANGTAVDNGDGTVTYTPNADFNGSDSFTYTISDGQGGTDTATVNVTVNAVNDAPSFTSGGNVTVAEDSGAYSAAWATNISAGAANESGQALTFTVTNNTNPALFSAAPSIASNGTLSFTSAANASGTASITVALKDDGGTANGGQDTSAPVTFTITVTAVNDNPVANPDTATVKKNSSVAIFILANDSDPDGGTLSVSGFTQPAHGSITYSAKNQNFRYTPAKGFSGTDTFTYTISDGQGGTATTTVTITVQ